MAFDLDAYCIQTECLWHLTSMPTTPDVFCFNMSKITWSQTLQCKDIVRKNGVGTKWYERKKRDCILFKIRKIQGCFFLVKNVRALLKPIFTSFL